MKIFQIKPTSNKKQWTFKLQETGDDEHYYMSSQDPLFTEIMHWDDKLGDYNYLMLPVYLPVEPQNPQKAIMDFYKLTMLQ